MFSLPVWLTLKLLIIIGKIKMKNVSQTSWTPTIFRLSHKIFWPTLDLLPVLKMQDISQSMSSFFFFNFLNWSIVDLQWFKYTVKWFSYTHKHTHTHVYIHVYIYVWIWSGPFAASPSSFPCCSGCFWTPKTRHTSPTTSLLSEGKKSSPYPSRWVSLSPQGSILPVGGWEQWGGWKKHPEASGNVASWAGKIIPTLQRSKVQLGEVNNYDPGHGLSASISSSV